MNTYRMLKRYMNSYKAEVEKVACECCGKRNLKAQFMRKDDPYSLFVNCENGCDCSRYNEVKWIRRLNKKVQKAYSKAHNLSYDMDIKAEEKEKRKANIHLKTNEMEVRLR